MRALLRRKYLLLTVVFTSLYQCCVAQPFSGCTEKLTNIALYEGSPASFPNIFQSQTTQWQVAQSFNDGNGLVSITGNSPDYSVQSPFESTYDVNSSTLIIFSSTVAPQGSMPYPTAGLYLLNNMDASCTSAAGLIVIKVGPVCSCDASDPNNKRLLCRVDFAYYANQGINPIFTWIDSSGVTVPTGDPTGGAIDGYDLQSWVSQLPRNDDGVYKCQLTFSNGPGDPDFVASNAPNFTESCFTSCPLLTTTPEPTTASVALNCSGQNLTHIVVNEGSPASFPRVINSQSVQWQVTPSSLTFSALKNITNYDDLVSSEFNQTYDVSQSQLTIFNSTVGPQDSLKYSTAGLYILNYRNPNCTTAANLIVIRIGPTCACISASLKLNCSVVYAESTTQPCNPIFTWINNNGQQMKQEQPVPKQFVQYVKTSQSQLTINSSDTSTYICQLTFSAPARSPLAYVASAPPSYNMSCSASCP